ncbi:hypothetical protein B9G49_15140 [Halorubrum sp. SD683]|nr:hypothetical protein B9G49_15140 [Halorubrum sp. SD683]
MRKRSKPSSKLCCDSPTIYATRAMLRHAHRLAKQSLAFTNSQDAGLRLVMFVVSLLLQNSWRYLHWRHVAPPPHDGAPPASTPFPSRLKSGVIDWFHDLIE